MPLSQTYPKAIVTGASSGLGLAFTQMLLDEGVEVWGSARDVSRLPEHPRFHPCVLDLSDTGSLAQFISKVAGECPDVKLLINNAGSGVFAPWDAFAVGEITTQMDVLLTNPIRLCRAFYPVMKNHGGGAIVNVSSLAAQFPLPMMPLYNAAKAGLSGFTRTLELESVGAGMVLIDFQPGDFRTAFNEQILKDEGMTEAAKRAWQSLEAHLQDAPLPEQAAKDLKRALERGRSGLVRSGGCFQARLAPLLARAVSWGVLRRVIGKYYKL